MDNKVLDPFNASEKFIFSIQPTLQCLGSKPPKHGFMIITNMVQVSVNLHFFINSQLVCYTIQFLSIYRQHLFRADARVAI